MLCLGMGEDHEKESHVVNGSTPIFSPRRDISAVTFHNTEGWACVLSANRGAAEDSIS